MLTIIIVDIRIGQLCNRGYLMSEVLSCKLEKHIYIRSYSYSHSIVFVFVIVIVIVIVILTS